MAEEKNLTKDFIELLKSLNEQQQVGLHLIIEGLQVLSERQKSGKNR